MPSTHSYALNDVIHVPGNAFRVKSHLGHGGMGEVYLVTDQKLGSDCVLKLLRASAAEHESIKELFLNEAKVLRRINHNNIVRVFWANETNAKEHFYLMEQLHGLSLADYLSRRRETGRTELRVYSALDLGIQLFRGLKVVHDAGVIHRDIKPHNLIIHRADGEQFLKLIDFGIIKLVTDATPENRFVGTPSYGAPEQIQCKRLTTAVDVFAAGVVMFELLTGRRPYKDVVAESDLVARSHIEAPLISQHGQFPPKLVELVAATLALDPAKRPSALDVARVLEPIKSVLPKHDAQHRMETVELLKDPTQDVQHITKAELDNATDPDGMQDMPWLAEVRRQHEMNEILGHENGAELNPTRLGIPKRPQAPADAEALAFATTKPMPPPRGETSVVLKNQTAPMPPPPAALPRHQMQTHVAKRDQPQRSGFDTGPMSAPPPTPLPISVERQIGHVRELDPEGANWQQALSKERRELTAPMPPPSLTPSAPNARKLVPGKDKIPKTPVASSRSGSRTRSFYVSVGLGAFVATLAVALLVFAWRAHGPSAKGAAR